VSEGDVFIGLVCVPVGERVSFELERQREVSPLKRRYFAAIGFYSVKTVGGK